MIELHNSHREEKERSVRTRGICIPSETKRKKTGQDRYRVGSCVKNDEEKGVCDEVKGMSRCDLDFRAMVPSFSGRRGDVRSGKGGGGDWKTNYLMVPIHIFLQEEGVLKLKLWMYM